MKQAILLNITDNVVTLLDAISPNEEVFIEHKGTQSRAYAYEEIPKGHKMSLVLIPANHEVIKYGEVIGVATRDIKPGQHVHVHNVASQRGRGDLQQKG